MYYTYVLFNSSFDRFYIGQTNDLISRLNKHNSGQVKSSKAYVPWELVWHMTFDTRAKSMDRERKLKNLKSQKRLIVFMKKHNSYIVNLRVTYHFVKCYNNLSKNSSHNNHYTNRLTIFTYIESTKIIPYKMKKLISYLFIGSFLLSFSILKAQECDVDVIAYEYDDEYFDDVLSDLYPLLPAMYNIAADDFMVTETQQVNTVCWPGTFWYLEDGVPAVRENGNSRSEVCTPDSRTFIITYYENDEGIPGEIIEQFSVTPSAVPIMLEEGHGYFFTATHNALTIPANTIHWISIQDATDDEFCDFTLLVGQPLFNAQRDQINTRENPGYVQGDGNTWSTSQSGNGIILTIGAANLAAIPTLSQWGLIILSILSLIFGVVAIRKHLLAPN